MSELQNLLLFRRGNEGGIDEGLSIEGRPITDHPWIAGLAQFVHHAIREVTQYDRVVRIRCDVLNLIGIALQIIEFELRSDREGDVEILSVFVPVGHQEDLCRARVHIRVSEVVNPAAIAPLWRRCCRHRPWACDSV